jgi:hypothetical protein
MQILKQRKIGTFMGMIKIIIGNISPYASWLSLALVGVMSFYTTINPLFIEWFGLPLPFWIFCGILILIVLSMAVVEWVFMMPSYFKAGNLQAWDAGGPLQDKITQMEHDISLIKEKLGIGDE